MEKKSQLYIYMGDNSVVHDNHFTNWVIPILSQRLVDVILDNIYYSGVDLNTACLRNGNECVTLFVDNKRLLIVF